MVLRTLRQDRAGTTPVFYNKDAYTRQACRYHLAIFTERIVGNTTAKLSAGPTELGVLDSGSCDVTELV